MYAGQPSASHVPDHATGMLLLVTLATGTVIGYLRGGRLRHLARVPLAAVVVSASYVLVAIWIAMALRTEPRAFRSS